MCLTRETLPLVPVQYSTVVSKAMSVRFLALSPRWEKFDSRDFNISLSHKEQFNCKNNQLVLFSANVCSFYHQKWRDGNTMHDIEAGVENFPEDDDLVFVGTIFCVICTTSPTVIFYFLQTFYLNKNEIKKQSPILLLDLTK